MFQEFPYTNFHELNLDWIVKIAKDFLDQYTHIQEVIQTGLDDLAESRETGLAELDQKRLDSLAELNQKTLDGLADLQDKYDTLDGLLQAWYDTHSADIADQLADAIADFNTAAETKSQALLDSWPDDYSELVTEYHDLRSALIAETGKEIVTGWVEDYGYNATSTTTTIDMNSPTAFNGYSCVALECSPGDVFFVTSKGASGYRNWLFLNSASGENNIIERAVAGNNNYNYKNERIVAPAGAKYVLFNAYTVGYTREVLEGDYLINVLQNTANELNSKINNNMDQTEHEIEQTVDLITNDTGIEIITGWTEGKYYSSANSIKSIDITTGMIDTEGYSCIALECSPGDVFYVTSRGGSGARNWIFLSKPHPDQTSEPYEENVILRSVAGTDNYKYTNRKVIVPPGATYVIFNAYTANYDRLVVKGEYVTERDEISILFVGNSLTQDGIAYLPYLLKNYYPDIRFRFYIWYQGGYTLTEHYQKFINDQVCTTFSVCENTQEWTNYSNSETMENILKKYTFNIVCLEGYYNYTPETPAPNTKPTDDITAWKNCQNYIQSNYKGNNSLEFITLFHAPLRSDADTVYERTEYWNARFLNKTIAQDMIPNGIAVYRALSTDLDALGDQGHLSPDGTHTQEGLPCLLQTYANACWLFDKLSINKSIYGCRLRITEAILDAINVPGPNPNPYTGHVITGTDAQNLLAQEIAIKAYKEGKKFVSDNIYIE